MRVTIFKNTNFGNNDLVWNIPEPYYEFHEHHEFITFDNVTIRFPLLTSVIALQGNYDFDTSFYDYMMIEDEKEDGDVSVTYYFIKSIMADRNLLLFSVVLDAITTHNILEQPISGTIVRKHDTNPSETMFDYPTAINVEGNYTNEKYDVVSYEGENIRFIESAINLSQIGSSVAITSESGDNIVIPQLPKPSHNTDYVVTSWGENQIRDDARALTLYLADSVNENVLNTVRGLSGDGAISDSYVIPSEAISVTSNNSEVSQVTGKFLTKYSNLKLEIDFDELDYSPRNEAVRAMFNISIASMQEKTKLTFPSWDLKNSVDDENRIKLNLWCDPKPSGAPYCCPEQVETLIPKSENDVTAIATLEVKSVKGGQWLKNPLIYSTGKGEIFSTVETRLQRERADYEKKVSLQQLEISKREQDIRIAQADYEYQSSLATSLIGGGLSLASKDFGGAFQAVKSSADGHIQSKFVDQLRQLKEYEQQTEKTLITMAHSNNLKNLNVSESIRRVVARDVVFQSNESLGSYEKYNGFTVTISYPDIETLKAKDIEYSKYGYPVFETVEDFVMLYHLRVNHTVYQFDSPLIEIGGKNGDMIREVLQSGIRILSRPYTRENILNNPKRGE